MYQPDKPKSFIIPQVSSSICIEFILMLAKCMPQEAKDTLLRELDWINHTTSIMDFLESKRFVQALDKDSLQKAIKLGSCFTIQASQELFDGLYSGGGQHLFNKAVVACISKIAEKGSTSMNSVCGMYSSFGEDYKELLSLQCDGNDIPARSTIAGWLTGDYSTVRLVRYAGIPCLLNRNGCFRPFLPGLDIIIKLVMAVGLKEFEKSGNQANPAGYMGSMLKRFLVHDGNSKLLTALVQSVSLAGTGTVSRHDIVTNKKVNNYGLVQGDAVGGDVNGGMMRGVGDNSTFFLNCNLGSPAPKKVDHSGQEESGSTPRPTPTPTTPVVTAEAAATPHRPLVSSEEAVGTFSMSVWNPVLLRWTNMEKRVTVDMLLQDEKKILAILDGSDMVVFEIESETFKFELKKHKARGDYLEIGRYALCNGDLEARRFILENSSKVKQLYEAFEDFKKATFPDFDPPSPSMDEEFEPPSDSED